MKKIICLIFLTIFSLNFANEHDLDKIDIKLSAECEPLTTIANCVNINSGCFFQVEHDLSSNSIDPIVLSRFYDSGSDFEGFFGLGFGSQFPLFVSDIEKGSRHNYVLINQREGFFIPYQRKKEHLDKFNSTAVYGIDTKILRKGYTNTNPENSHANFVNWKAIYQSKYHSEGSQWIVELGDGTRRIYKTHRNIDLPQMMRMDLPLGKIYLLDEEIKANGNRLKFQYIDADGKPRPSSIQTLNRSGTTVLNELSFRYSQNQCSVESSCGRKGTYSQKEKHSTVTLAIPQKFEDEAKKTTLTQSVTTQNDDISYQYRREGKHPCITKVKKSNGYFIDIEYDKEHRVKKLVEPLGVNDEPILTFQFQYRDDHTNVLNALKQITVYHFNARHNLSHIDYKQDNQIIKQEKYRWSAAVGEEGWLRSKSIQLGEQIYYLKFYQYDKKGNITSEALFGNICGDKSETFTFEQRGTVDKYQVEYTYSDLNLIIQKRTPDGLIIDYTYLPGTNLCTKELYSFSNLIQKRIFRDYDDKGQVRAIIEDDGSAQDEADLANVTWRRSKMIEAITEQGRPSFGKPRLVKEFIFKQGQMVPLKQIEFTYDQKGNEICQKVYDSQSSVCYLTNKNYDDRGLVISETNALGEQTLYVYDKRRNKIEEEKLNSGKKTYYTYDAGNRLIRKDEHKNNDIYVTKYRYNALGQLISETDSFGLETFYAYDRLGRQTECKKPSMQDSEGHLINPKITKKYNLLDQAIAITDENGFTTSYKYNVYGKPIEIHHPDGAIERYSYYLNGRLKQKWLTDGSSERYTYDPFGQMIKEQILDPSEKVLKEVMYEYKSTLLLSKTDAMGLKTIYRYNGAGRKIQEITGDSIISYEYDDLERVVQISRLLTKSEAQHELYSYDNLNRITSKTLQDHEGRIYAHEEYDYDVNGNIVKKIIKQSESESAIYLYRYNADGKLLWSQNPLKHQIKKDYDNHHVNEFNQSVQVRTLFDELNRPIIEIDDALHRLVKKEEFSNDQKESSVSYYYDAKGNLVKKHVSVLINGQHLRDYVVILSYDNRDRLISETERPDGKTTRYSYNLRGLLEKKIKPDGVILNYEYDFLARLTRLFSSDGTVDYSYVYDLHDNPIKIGDRVNGTDQERVYDIFSRLIQEKPVKNSFLNYRYDNLDRLVEITLPDHTSIHYEYDLFNLKKVRRHNENGLFKYEYICKSHDLKGRLTKGMSSAGETNYTYDLIGNAIKIEAPEWKSVLDQIDPVGNVLSIAQADPEGTWQEKLNYDRLNHLIHEVFQGRKYQYDSIGNCLHKNNDDWEINDLNQISSDGKSNYRYDVNGNLITQTEPSIDYKYDALNRLISIEQDGILTSFVYDAFDRCVCIKTPDVTKELFYLGDKEIASRVNQKLKELRLFYPSTEMVFAIELDDEVYFPLQDFRYNICALQASDGTIQQWYRYTAFGEKVVYGNETFNPWCFANRREVCGMLLYAHRFYNPQLMRWQTTDPLGFRDGFNLYAYSRNNPFRYTDPDGRWVIAIPIVTGIFEAAGIVFTFTTLEAVCTAAGVGLIGWSVYELDKHSDKHHSEQIDDEKEKRKNKFPENPDDLLPDLERDNKGRIHPADNIRIRPEKHDLKEGESYQPRHHGQHYHVESKRDPNGGWKRPNTEIIKPPGYIPGDGTGFIPGEIFPGII